MASNIINIVVGAAPVQEPSKPPRYLIPLSLQNVTDQIEITITINNTSFDIFFNLNSLNNNLFMSAYSIDRTVYYFAGYQCVFGNYINLIDNGCPYLFYFVDKSNGQNYSKNSLPIDYNALSNGVKLYAELR